ncbi:galactosylceramide sulfotransferase-like [Glandiceps talaboti]
MAIANDDDDNTEQLLAVLQELVTKAKLAAQNEECTKMIYERTCKETRRVVFVKTHKTGGTTVASIIERFGFTRNLSFVVPPDRKYGPHILSSTQLFHRKMLAKSPPTIGGAKYYDMLTNHVRYNRYEMDAVIPNAVYITIIRHPVKHFESAFAYFMWNRVVVQEEGEVDDPIVTFMENTPKYMKKKFYFWWQAHNGQLFDLGLSPSQTDDDIQVDQKLRTLNKELDLVLIADYFDESLIILMKELCWTMEDILYIPNTIRSRQYRRQISEETAEEILEWNTSDFILFQHFNRTLWQKIDDYGPCFEVDLKLFREKRQKVMNECVESDRVVSRRDPRETRYVLKANASELCKNLWRGDVTFTELLRNRQLKGRILYPPNT